MPHKVSRNKACDLSWPYSPEFWDVNDLWWRARGWLVLTPRGGAKRRRVARNSTSEAWQVFLISRLEPRKKESDIYSGLFMLCDSIHQVSELNIFLSLCISSSTYFVSFYIVVYEKLCIWVYIENWLKNDKNKNAAKPPIRITFAKERSISNIDVCSENALQGLQSPPSNFF